MRHLILSLILFLLLGAIVLLFVLCPRQVYGTVSDALGGEPVAGATISTGERSVYSNQSGQYNFGWVYGSLTLTVSMDGYLPIEVQVPSNGIPGQAIPLYIALTPNAVSGTVLDAETGDVLPGSVVTVEHGLRVVADEQGQYTLRRVKAGTLFGASMPGYIPSTAVFHGQEVQDFVLQPTETRVKVLDLYSQQPVSGAMVLCRSMQLFTDASGEVIIKRLLKGTRLLAQYAGYAVTDFIYDGSDSVTLFLRPNTLRGVIRDSSANEPVEGAVVTIVSAGRVFTSSITGADGCYSFGDLPSSITLVVAAAGYDRAEVEVGPVTELNVNLKRFQAKGIYLPFGLLANEKRVRELIDLVSRTELNTIVVDVKSDQGWLAYPSEVAAARRSRAYKAEVMDITKFLSLCRKEGIYTIARLVVFKDPALAAAYPEWAVRTESGELWKDLGGASWGDPFRKEVQDYNIAIAKEVAMLGFDELQFDYLRFPSDGNVGEIRYAQESTRDTRCKAITEFCARLRRELEPYSVLLSADIFGLTVWVSPEEDMGIGQRVIDIASYMDYISPMLYPATFESGNLGYDEPTSYPYEIVYRSCVELSKRTKTRVRPWLQHYAYDVEQLHLQKKAAGDARTWGWLFWNAAGKYNELAFDSAVSPE